MPDSEVLVNVEALVKRYPPLRSYAGVTAVTALDGISLAIRAGTTLALVGRSGSGKSTFGLCLACLERPTSGRIWFEGRNVAGLPESVLRTVRPRIQLIFQDAARAMNPRMRASEIVAEPLLVQGSACRGERLERVQTLFRQVGLAPSSAQDRLAEFSGGQRQRLAIARALALQPKILILDEALSALDCSVQAQIANLLLELQTISGITLVYITHDLAMAAHLADQIAVLERGRIVEFGTVDEVVRRPQHGHTKALLAALPRFESAQTGFRNTPCGT